MDQKKPLNLLLTLLLLSYLLSPEAAPLSRILALRNQDEAITKVINKEMPVEEAASVNRRMDIELNDYPGSGANSRHDPKNPGKP